MVGMPDAKKKFIGYFYQDHPIDASFFRLIINWDTISTYENPISILKQSWITFPIVVHLTSLHTVVSVVSKLGLLFSSSNPVVAYTVDSQWSGAFWGIRVR